MPRAVSGGVQANLPGAEEAGGSMPRGRTLTMLQKKKKLAGEC